MYQEDLFQNITIIIILYYYIYQFVSNAILKYYNSNRLIHIYIINI